MPGCTSGSGGTLFGGGGKAAHRILRAMCTPRMMMFGVSCSALAAKKPIWVNKPARCVGSSSSLVNSVSVPPGMPYRPRTRALAYV
jgi:hypothetical protein